jgi:hypothetical protein
VVWLALLWAAFLFRWAADWFGHWGGLVALTLFTFDPNILAHATLATNDVGFAAFSLIALFAAMRLLRQRQERSKGVRRSNWGYVILAGLALGASLSAKSSGFFTALALATYFPLAALPGGAGRGRRAKGAILHLLLILCLGLLVLWATYGFEFRPVAKGGPSVPMATQWEVWREMREHLRGGHTSYLMGQTRDTGWVSYYPLAFALKTPFLTLALFALALVVTAASGPRRWSAMLPLWIYLGGYATATLLSTVNTGYRFLLPALPFAFLLIAGLFRDGISWLQSPGLRRGSWIGLALLSIAVGVKMHPHYLTYFNFVAGGPARGHRYLVDSNLDWGQSFIALKEYLDENVIEQVWTSHYTYAGPGLYGIDHQPIAPAPGAPPVLSSRFDPAPGVYAIGATTLQGVMVADPDTYDWFRHKEPVSRPGTALFVYRVEPHDQPPNWLAQCTVPTAPLSVGAAEEGFGQRGLRMAYFDCTSGWLYPNGAESPGWYALFRDIARSDDTFIKAHLGESELSYEQRRSAALPTFAIYEQVSPPALPRFTLDTPAEFDHLTLLGYTTGDPNAALPGRTIEVQTWWRVVSLSQRPLSIMLHLTGPEGVPAVVGDGLAVPIEQWQVGDVIVQRHKLSLPANAPPGEYTPATGVYWLDTMERWTITQRGEPMGDELALPALLVENEQ